MYVKHFPTRIKGIKANLYVCETVNDLIKDICTPGKDRVEVMCEMLTSQHWYLDQYIDIPRGIEGDHLIREITTALNYFIMSLFNTYEEYFELIIEGYNTNKRIEFQPGSEGIWIEVPLP